MSRTPRILPLVAVAIGGVLAVNAIANAPQLISATKAFAEGAAAPAKTAPMPGLDSKSPATATGPKAPAPVCAPTAEELAKAAGLSPQELKVLQNLSDRRGQLDQRASDLDVQVSLIAAAEAKLDARIQQMNGLKSDIQTLLGQADQQQQTETESLVRVYEAMKPKDAAARITLMDDSVRLPMAAKMKERALSAILAQMAPEDAKALTEKLAKRVLSSAAITGAQAAINPSPGPVAAQTPPPAPTATAAAAPTPAAEPAVADAAKPAPAAKPHRRYAAKGRSKFRSKAVRTAHAAPAADDGAAIASKG